MDEDSDDLEQHTERLAARAREGDGDAREDLFARMRPFLLATVRRHGLWPKLRGSASEEDLVHETVERVLRSGSLERLEDRGPRSVRKTLAAAVDHVILDQARRLDALRRGGGNAKPDAPLDTQVQGTLEALRDPTPTADARTREMIELCRKELSEDEFEIWRRAHLEGRSSEEIGQELGRPASTVRNTMQSVRRRLIQRLVDAQE